VARGRRGAHPGQWNEGDVVRPWYVLGPGHWWPYALVPFYWIAELLPPARESRGVWTGQHFANAQRAGLGRRPSADDVQILGRPEIRELALAS